MPDRFSAEREGVATYPTRVPGCQVTGYLLRTAHAVSRSSAASPTWSWALVRHLGRREHMDDSVQAIAGLLSQQQAPDWIMAWEREH